MKDFHAYDRDDRPSSEESRESHICGIQVALLAPFLKIPAGPAHRRNS